MTKHDSLVGTPNLTTKHENCSLYFSLHFSLTMRLKNQKFVRIARMRDQHSPRGRFQRGGRSCNDCKQSSKS